MCEQRRPCHPPGWVLALSAAVAVGCAAVVVFHVARAGMRVLRAAHPEPPIGSRCWLEHAWNDAPLGTGDVLLIHTPESHALRQLCRTWFTHVALTVRIPDRGGTTEVVGVLECDVPRVSIMPLDAWRAKYDSPGALCVWRKLLLPRRSGGPVSVWGADAAAAAAAMAPLLGRPYPTPLTMLARRAATAVSASTPGHCVDTACAVLRALGVPGLPESECTRNWTPDDLARFDTRALVPTSHAGLMLPYGGRQHDQGDQVQRHDAGLRRHRPGGEHVGDVSPRDAEPDQDAAAAQDAQDNDGDARPPPLGMMMSATQEECEEDGDRQREDDEHLQQRVHAALAPPPASPVVVVGRVG